MKSQSKNKCFSNFSLEKPLIIFAVFVNLFSSKVKDRAPPIVGCRAMPKSDNVISLVIVCIGAFGTDGPKGLDEASDVAGSAVTKHSQDDDDIDEEVDDDDGMVWKTLQNMR